MREDEIQELFEDSDVKETKQQPSKKKKGKEPLDKSRRIQITIDTKPEDIVQVGRDLGYSEASIRRVIQKNFSKLKKADIDLLLEKEIRYKLFDTKTFGFAISLPSAFRNVLGGITKGMVLFQDLQSEIDAYRKAEKRTPQEILNYALETLKEHSIYKQQSGNKALQEQLQLAVINLMKPIKDTPTLIKRINTIKRNI